MYASQFGERLGEPILEPQKDLDSYGSIAKEVPELLMPAATESLVSEYLSGYYMAYPIMFYKEVKLNQANEEKMATIIEELTGLTKAELDNFTDYEPGGFESVMGEDGNPAMVYKPMVLPEYNDSETLTYERFRELMEEADKLIGGGSQYAVESMVSNFSRVPMTYEEAMAEYEEKMQQGNLANVYTRLFSDYVGIILAIMPIFVCVSLWQMDNRAHMEQLIYSRKISSAKIVGIRYLALISSMLVPVLLTFLHAVMGVNNLYPDKNISWINAAGLAAIWLIPSILIVTAVGALISELISPLLAIFVQGVWWYVAAETTKLTGNITKWTLMIRHNTLGKEKLFQSQYDDFLWNRIFYIILAVICLVITIFIYEKKRRGGTLWKYIKK